MQTWVSVVRINKFLNSEDLDAEAVTHLKDGKITESPDIYVVYFTFFITTFPLQTAH